MSYLQNLHTHTTFCDGKHTPEEMVHYAIGKGFDSLGFSGHSRMVYSPYSKVTVESTEQYKKEINTLKSRYADRLKIYLGLEVDIYSNVDLSGYDYLIGSVHYLKMDEGYIGIDRSAPTIKNLIDTHFQGDSLRLAKTYYETVSMLPQYGGFDIIGHFDLITKNIEIMPLFDIEGKSYMNLAFDAMHALKDKIPFFEVNTGAVARGFRSTPYPCVNLMKELNRLGFGAVITSDCHDGTKLDCGFADARLLLKLCGFKSHYILTDTAFEAIDLL